MMTKTSADLGFSPTTSLGVAGDDAIKFRWIRSAVPAPRSQSAFLQELSFL